MKKQSVYLLDIARTPRGRQGGELNEIFCGNLAGAAITKLIERHEDVRALIDEVILAQSLPTCNPSNIARYAALAALIDEAVPARTVHANTLSGMQAIRSSFYQIASGQSALCVAGGVDSYSTAPFSLRNVRGSFKEENRIICDTIKEGEMCTQPAPSDLKQFHDKVFGASPSRGALEFSKTLKQKIEKAKLAPPDDLAGLEYEKRKLGAVRVTRDEWAFEGEDTSSRIAPYSDGAAAALLVGSMAPGAALKSSQAELCAFSFVGCRPEEWHLSGGIAVEKLLSQNNLTIGDISVLEICETSLDLVSCTIEKLRDGADAFPVVNPFCASLSLGKNDGADAFLQLGNLCDSLKPGQFGVACTSSPGGMGMAMLIKKLRG